MAVDFDISQSAYVNAHLALIFQLVEDIPAQRTVFLDGPSHLNNISIILSLWGLRNYPVPVNQPYSTDQVANIKWFGQIGVGATGVRYRHNLGMHRNQDNWNTIC